MMKTNRIVLSLAGILVALAASVLISSPAASAEYCDEYPNSRRAFFGDMYACAYTGAGCEECYDDQTGGYCIYDNNGSAVCGGPDVRH